MVEVIPLSYARPTAGTEWRFRKIHYFPKLAHFYLGSLNFHLLMIDFPKSDVEAAWGYFCAIDSMFSSTVVILIDPSCIISIILILSKKRVKFELN